MHISFLKSSMTGHCRHMTLSFGTEVQVFLHQGGIHMYVKQDIGHEVTFVGAVALVVPYRNIHPA